MRVALFIPCFVDALAPRVASATRRVLERLGHEVVVPEGVTCCGQPALNAGRTTEAAHLATRLVRLLEQTSPDAVVAPSGSCVAALRVAGPRHLGLSSGVLDTLYELTEFLVRVLGVSDVGARFPGRVTWHDACHPLRELGLRDEPRILLRHVRELEFVESRPSDECCGFGGTFAVKAPEVSAGMGARKIAALEASGAAWVASTEGSCLLQIDGLLRRRRSAMGVVHVAEILGSAS